MRAVAASVWLAALCGAGVARADAAGAQAIAEKAAAAMTLAAAGKTIAQPELQARVGKEPVAPVGPHPELVVALVVYEASWPDGHEVSATALVRNGKWRWAVVEPNGFGSPPPPGDPWPRAAPALARGFADVLEQLRKDCTATEADAHEIMTLPMPEQWRLSILARDGALAGEHRAAICSTLRRRREPLRLTGIEINVVVHGARGWALLTRTVKPEGERLQFGPLELAAFEPAAP
jgi:hypothetical protein